MADQQAFELLKEFFEHRPVCARAAAPLSSKVEIGIVINKNIECAFFRGPDNKPRFEARPAKSPDVVFFIQPDAVKQLVAVESDDIGEFGIHIAKLYLAGTVRFKVHGSLISFVTGGYIGVLKEGGSSFMKFLAQHGLVGLTKIKDFVQAMRK